MVVTYEAVSVNRVSVLGLSATLGAAPQYFGRSQQRGGHLLGKEVGARIKL